MCLILRSVTATRSASQTIQTMSFEMNTQCSGFAKCFRRVSTTDTSAMPERIQRKRTKGWRMPPNTVYVGRPSRWGNRFTIEESGSAEQAVLDYEYWIGWDTEAPVHFGKALREAVRRELRGKNLCCWCPLDQPCHADVLLEIANDW